MGGVGHTDYRNIRCASPSLSLKSLIQGHLTGTHANDVLPAPLTTAQINELTALIEAYLLTPTQERGTATDAAIAAFSESTSRGATPGPLSRTRKWKKCMIKFLNKLG